jgi:hypothetical protein
LARLGGDVTGVDAAHANICAAHTHARQDRVFGSTSPWLHDLPLASTVAPFKSSISSFTLTYLNATAGNLSPIFKQFVYHVVCGCAVSICVDLLRRQRH